MVLVLWSRVKPLGQSMLEVTKMPRLDPSIQAFSMRPMLSLTSSSSQSVQYIQLTWRETNVLLDGRTTRLLFRPVCRGVSSRFTRSHSEHRSYNRFKVRQLYAPHSSQSIPHNMLIYSELLLLLLPPVYYLHWFLITQCTYDSIFLQVYFKLIYSTSLTNDTWDFCFGMQVWMRALSRAASAYAAPETYQEQVLVRGGFESIFQRFITKINSKFS